jgi:hypothetical protein
MNFVTAPRRTRADSRQQQQGGCNSDLQGLPPVHTMPGVSSRRHATDGRATMLGSKACRLHAGTMWLVKVIDTRARAGTHRN